jgi:hypothetical protein
MVFHPEAVVIPNDPNSNDQKKSLVGDTSSSTMFESFEHLIFGFVSYFDIRI